MLEAHGRRPVPHLLVNVPSRLWGDRPPFGRDDVAVADDQGEQRHYTGFAPRLNHGDAAILRVQHWLQANGARDVTPAAMAEHAGLDPRTVLRRFQRATGLRPTEYCQHLRISRAREMLKLSTRKVAQVAWEVGYGDEAAFRKVFRKDVGFAPGAYRLRFRPCGNGANPASAIRERSTPRIALRVRPPA